MPQRPTTSTATAAPNERRDPPPVFSEAALRALVRHTEVGIWQLDDRGRSVDANPAMCRMLEIDDPDEIRGRPCADFYTAASHDVLRAELQRRHRGDCGTYGVELVGARGTHRHVVVCGTPVLAPDGRLTATVATVTDVTAHKRSQGDYRLLMDHAGDAILLQRDDDGTILDANPQAGELLGCAPERLVGRTIDEFIDPAEYTRLPRQRGRIRAGEAVRFERELRRADDGRAVQTEVTLHPVPGGRMMAIVRDVADRRRAEARLRRRAALDALVASVSTRLVGAAADRIDAEIEAALGEMAGFAGADRSFIYRYSDDLSFVVNTHEWCAPGVKSIRAAAPGRKVPTAQFTWSFPRIRAGEVLRHTVDALPPEAVAERKFMREQGLAQSVAVPMFVGRQLVAALGFNTTRPGRGFDAEDVDVLRLAGQVFLNAMDRQRVERDRQRQTDLLDAQNRALEMIARGAAVTEVLSALAASVEAQAEGCASAVLLTDPTGVQLSTAATGPRLPRGFVDTFPAVVPVGPEVGTCGAAAALRRPVHTPDIATDPNWAGGRHLAVAHGLRACWSFPIVSCTGDVLGTFAAYFTRPGEPPAELRPFIESAASLAAVAIDRHRDEQRTRHAHRELTQLVEHAPIAVMTFDARRRITAWNPASERIFGWSEAEAVGRTIAEVMVPPEKREEHDRWWSQVAAGGALQGVEFTRRRKDGTPVELALWTCPLRADEASGGEAGAVAFVAEVTEQRKLKDQLLRSARMESIGRLAGGVAHDFNNLLAVISGYSESMLRRTDADHPLRGHVEEIYRAATRGAGLTQQLLAFSRRQRVATERLDLSESVRHVYGMLRRVISDKIEIEVQAAPATGDGGGAPRAFVVADAGQIEQVLVNLAINARDAMPDGGRMVIATDVVDVPTTDAAAERAATPPLLPGRYARLSVSDTGVGMTREVSQQIFEPFFSTKGLPRDPSQHGGGTGLGLSIVYGIVQQAGGGIAVRSAPGQGARFEIYLPYAG